jgi:ubiquinone/menaquinone biosynthesis C-methylase UbiE
MTPAKRRIKLKLLPSKRYLGINDKDPIRYYFYPWIGHYYRRRVELCLEELSGGERVLEVGFGTGVSFFNLHELYHETWGIDLTASTDAIAALFREEGIETNLQNGSVFKMPYPDDYFDSVLLISILEHIEPEEQISAFREICRVLKPGGQVVYGTPIERPFMVFLFRVLGVNIREHHFSTEREIAEAAEKVFSRVNQFPLRGLAGLAGPIYEIGHFIKRPVLE